MSEIDDIIKASKEDFAKKKTVAFIGERRSGKTVIAAILKHAMVNHFVKLNPQWKVWVVEGSSRINDITKKLTTGEFPSSTLPGDASPITLEVFSNEGTGGGIKITLQDMAGESKEEFLRAEFKNEEDRVRDIFTQQPIEGKSYGMLAHLAFAKIYILVVDCDKFKNWENEQSYLANTIRSLSLIQKRVDNDNNGKIVNPIAVIFSKYDSLLKEEERKTAVDLLNELPEFKSALEIAHKGNRKLFLSEIKTERRTEQELDEFVKKEISTKNTELNQIKSMIEDTEKIFENMTNEYQDMRQQFDNAKQELKDVEQRGVQTEIQDAQAKVTEIERKCKQSKEAYEDANEMLRMHNLNKTEIETRIANEQPSAADLGISEFRPAIPLSYNTDAYIDLIYWIIEMSKE